MQVGSTYVNALRIRRGKPRGRLAIEILQSRNLVMFQRSIIPHDKATYLIPQEDRRFIRHVTAFGLILNHQHTM